MSDLLLPFLSQLSWTPLCVTRDKEGEREKGTSVLRFLSLSVFHVILPLFHTLCLSRHCNIIWDITCAFQKASRWTIPGPHFPHLWTHNVYEILLSALSFHNCIHSSHCAKHSALSVSLLFPSEFSIDYFLVTYWTRYLILDMDKIDCIVDAIARAGSGKVRGPFRCW